MIVIIDYGGGNVRSVKNALDRLGVISEITCDKTAIMNAERIIFPGQGHFGTCMEVLQKRGLVDCIREAANTKPFLGICVGMQLLFDGSEEAADVPGLGVLKGQVKKFSVARKVPHMGWNRVDSPGTMNGHYYYFAHSYYCMLDEPGDTAATTDYEEQFVSAVVKGELLAVQFHPEKSGPAGMALLRRFIGGEYVN